MITHFNVAPWVRPVRNWLPLLLASIVVAGCTTNAIGGVRGSGTLMSESRDVSGFTEVVLEGSGTVNVDITGAESLTIEAEDNLMSRLTSEVADGKLTLGTRGIISATKDIVYTVTAVALDAVNITGSGEIIAGDISGAAFTADIGGSGAIELAGLEVGQLDATISGSGHIDVAGVAQSIDVGIPGSGRFDGEQLEARTGAVAISGSGTALVNVTEALEASVSGSGTIRYLGNPIMDSNISGSGTIGPA